jgi:DNA-directed RNA polymerase subunit K/omega
MSEQAIKNIGNIFETVLVASIRMREIHERRREQEQSQEIDIYQLKKLQTPASQAMLDIENGVVGREYLLKLNQHTKPRVRRAFKQ